MDSGPGAADDTWPLVAAEAEQLADEISESWSTSGRPDALHFGAELDVVCSGGGWRNMYCGGAYSVLRVLEQRGELVVCRAAGASSGALAAATIGCNSGGRLRYAKPAGAGRSDEARDEDLIPCRDWYRLHDAWDVIYQRHGFGQYCPTLRGFIRAFYPADAHKRCAASRTRFSVAGVFAPDDHNSASGGATATASWLCPWKWPRPVRQLLAEDFVSFADFESGILASSALPFIIGSPFFHYWRGYRCLDGGLVDNCPLFRDDVRPQLVVDLTAIPGSPPTEMLLLRSQEAETSSAQATSRERELGCGRHRVMQLWQAGMRDCARTLVGDSSRDSSVPMRLLHGDGCEQRSETKAANGSDRGPSAATSAFGTAWATATGAAELVKLFVKEIPVLLWFLLWLLRQKLLH